MKPIRREKHWRAVCLAGLLGVIAASCCLGADPVVSGVRLAQRPGTKLVDIGYDLAAEGPAWVSLRISADDGATWTVPAMSLTGAIGNGVAPGANKAIVWDMGADWPNQRTTQLRVEITATAVTGDAIYLLIDLAAGPSASSYPVSTLDAVPSGGWTDVHKTTTMVLRRIPAGTFTMGSPIGELGRGGDQEAQHQVTLTKDFYIGVFEVTQRQWYQVMGTWPSHLNNTACRDTRPVEQVSYYYVREDSADNSDDPAVHWPITSAVNANSFIGRLRARTGLASLDLPTEAQWEYACRAGTTTALNSGKDITDERECPNVAEVARYWHNGGAGYDPGADLSGATAGVGSYRPNAWGLYDMHGNVWEWCLDWYGTYPGAVTDPSGASSGSARVARGGSWFFVAGNCGSARRFSIIPELRVIHVGCRLCSAIPEP